MIFAVGSRLFVFAVAIASSMIFSLNPACKSIGCWTISLPFINIFARWDSGFYADIALTGYGTTITPRWEFFPLYPILMGIVGRLIAFMFPIPLDLAVYVAGFVISNVAFFGCVYFLFQLSDLVLGNTRTAAQSGILLALYPAGVFLSAVYSESVFLLLVLTSLIYWYRIKHPLSGVLGFLAGLARPVGVLLAIPYVYEVLTDRSARKSALNYISVVAVLMAFVSFLAYSQIMTGTPFATFAAERLYWKVTLSPTYILTLARNEIIDHPIILPYLAMGIGGVLASILTARSRAEKEIALFSIILVAAYLFTPIISFPRYSITLVPMYWNLSKLCNLKWLRIFIYAAFLVLLAVGTAQFVNWYSFY